MKREPTLNEADLFSNYMNMQDEYARRRRDKGLQ